MLSTLILYFLYHSLHDARLKWIGPFLINQVTRDESPWIDELARDHHRRFLFN